MLAYSLIIILIALAAVIFSMKRDLMMLQQNSNRNDRYRRWMDTNGESTRPGRLLAIIVAMIFLLRFVSLQLELGLVGAASVVNLFGLLRAKYKKPLVFTKRAIRIFSVGIALVLTVAAAAAAAGHLSGHSWIPFAAFALTASYAVSYGYILLANRLLQPIEKRINKKYYDEAAGILASMPDLKVIGITGSYGKTSTKHYLYRILAEKYDVLMTPGNFNTLLGVIRTVREYMKPYNQVFIVEMGAKQPNDIKEICDLVHPQIGVITAVGPQHLESFKTIERVQQTKFELADSIPADGLVVLNNDFEYIANRPVNNAPSLRYTAEDEAQAGYKATDITYSPQGTHFTISTPDGGSLCLFTHLVGRCNVSNLVGAVIVALHLGVSHEQIRYAVEKIQQVEHRLNMKRTASGITIIDDAYNSNPVGSAMALEVLSGMQGGRRIIITPGMIELGDDQERLNREFGEKIARSADVAIIVGAYNRQAIKEGIISAGMAEDKIIIADTFSMAQQQMLALARPGDTVLYENDLPDTFK